MSAFVSILMVMAAIGLVIAFNYDKKLAFAFVITECAVVLVMLFCITIAHSVKPLDTLLMALLCLDAAWVAQGTIRKRNMWSWIALYWVILTLKCLLHYLEH